MKVSLSSKKWLFDAARKDAKENNTIDIAFFNVQQVEPESDFYINIKKFPASSFPKNLFIEVDKTPWTQRDPDNNLLEFKIRVSIYDYDSNWDEVSIKDELINLPGNIQEFFLYHLNLNVC